MKKLMDIYHGETGGDMMAGREKHECYDVAASDSAVWSDDDGDAVAWLVGYTHATSSNNIHSCKTFLIMLGSLFRHA